MPRITGLAGRLLVQRRLVPQPPQPPTRVTMRRRRRPNGFGPNQPVLHYCPPNPLCSLPVETEAATGILISYRREMAQCNERACLCTCHCHAGPNLCYRRDGLTEGNPDSFGHRRTPNPSHKSAHRECPKEGREHNRK